MHGLHQSQTLPMQLNKLMVTFGTLITLSILDVLTSPRVRQALARVTYQEDASH
jgi:hypothetical protein